MGGTAFMGTPGHPFTALPCTKLCQIFFFFPSGGEKENRTETVGVVEAIPAFEAYGACPKPCPLPSTRPECQGFPMPLCGVFVQKCMR